MDSKKKYMIKDNTYSFIFTSRNDWPRKTLAVASQLLRLILMESNLGNKQLKINLLLYNIRTYAEQS